MDSSKTQLTKLTSMFGKDPIKKVQDKSKSIVSVFTKTITDLSSVNTEINSHVEERQTKIKNLASEVDLLATQKTENEKLIAKLNKLFE